MELERHIFKVSELTGKTRQYLEVNFSSIWVEGEISGLSRPASGHWYFTLKDDNAQIRVACFSSINRQLTFEPKQGDLVLVRGRITLYEPRGDFQLIANHLESSGEGALQRAFEKLKHQLKQEGLFDLDRKRSLPAFPNHIAVITSPTGAVIQDILTVLKRRFPLITITVIPTQVQGIQGAKFIVSSFKQAARLKHIDLIILARGGGSLEDLQPFNEESVARAIAASKYPVISAVGHETDVTIADFVADVRAPTPSVAAEIASPDQLELYGMLKTFQQRLQDTMVKQLQQNYQKLDYLRSALRHPKHSLDLVKQKLSNIQVRMARAMQTKIREREKLLSYSKKSLMQCNLNNRIALNHHLVSKQNLYMLKLMNQHIETKRLKLQYYAKALNSLSPLTTLSRGYSIARSTSGHIINDASLVKKGQMIEVVLKKGALECEVKSTSTVQNK